MLLETMLVYTPSDLKKEIVLDKVTVKLLKFDH
jgi:hypothetical protein